MKAQLESLLTRIPMYLLVNGSLSALILIALLYSLFSLTSFSAPELLASTTVFCVVSVGVSYLLGKLLRLHSHLQSALITALILSLIYAPSFDPLTLASYAIIAAIAIASKFIIAPRGRHVFNPAALGAFIGGLLQLQYASWWIGSPTFIILVTIVSFAILYKTRQLILAGSFIITGVVLFMTAGVLRGETVFSLLQTILTSWPLVFMAGIMLSEPLTLPPRRWQRLTLAVIVATITVLPFQIGGWFNSSPAFALIVGNLFAFTVAWRERGGVRLAFKERISLTSTIEEYIFTTDRPLYFTPGQYIELTLPHAHQDLRGIRRTFSITSSPGESEIRLGIRFYPRSSSFKQALRQLKPGAFVQTTGINGDFVLPRNPRRKLLFIAGGIGITPFISHIRSLAERDSDVTLLYFNRNIEDIAYQSLLNVSGVTVHYISDSRLTQNILTRNVPDLAERDVYISGPPAMVANAKEVIGHGAKRVHTDYFSGY